MTIVISLGWSLGRFGLLQELAYGFLRALPQGLLSASLPCVSKNPSLNDSQGSGQSV